MRRPLVQAILLSGLLCASGLASTERLDEAQFVNSCAPVRVTLPEIAPLDRDGQHSHVPIGRLADSEVFYFVSGMVIDADGAPNAYHPDDTGLDEVANAGAPGRWNGIVTDRAGIPLVQQESDPFPGYYISCTSLADETKTFTDPTGYVDASHIPYVALPQDVAEPRGTRLGDFALVINLRNGKSSFAIYADIGTLGEGSIALAEALGIWSNARHGGVSEGILYVFFPGSGNLRPRTIDEIQTEGETLLSRLGGIRKLVSCAEPDDASEFRLDRSLVKKADLLTKLNDSSLR